jgi:hypothetical protein
LTEFEILKLADIYLTRMAVASMDITTVFFAYVVCAFLAGSKLSRFLAVGVSVMYSLFLMGPTAVLFTSSRYLAATYQQYNTLFPHGAFPAWTDSSWVITTLPMVPVILAWTSSLIYMHANVRKTIEVPA